VLNQERSAQLGVNIHPLSADAEADTAEVVQGIYKQISRDSRAHIARSWAYNRAVKSGRGVYRIGTRYAEDVGGHPFDQVITIERILHQDSVYFDPSAQEPDYSDAEWAFVTSWVPYDQFVEQYGESAITGVDDQEFQDLIVASPQWVKGEGKTRAVLIAEYFRKEHEEETIYQLEDGTVVRKGEKGFERIDSGEPVTGNVMQRDGKDLERTRDVTKLMWYKLTAKERLESEEWNGKHIPLVPVLGEELQPFDDQRRFFGMVRPAMDAQRLFNYAASGLAEMAALEPKAPFIADPKQIENYEAWWQQANVRNFPILPANFVVDGQVLGPPQRATVDTNRLGPSMMLLQNADDFIQSSTSTFDPALGQLDQRDRSGRAVLALQNQADTANSNYLHNLTAVAMVYEAKVILDMIPRIYDRRGRLVRTLDEQDETDTVMLNQVYITDVKTKRPIPLQITEEGQPIPMLPMSEETKAVMPKPKHYDIKRGIYGVSVSVGRAYQTRLQEGADKMGNLLSKAPQLIPLLGPDWLKYLDFPGSKEAADVLKKVRDSQYPMLKGDEEMPSPQQLQAQNQQLQQQLETLQQQLQQAVEQIKTDQAKQQATLQKTQMDNETRMSIEQLKASVDIMVQQMKGQQDAREGRLDRDHEMEKEKFEAGHEVALEAEKAMHQPVRDGGGES
jgi:hypothetical protein